MRFSITLLVLAACALAQPFDRSPGYPGYRRADALFVARKIPEALAALEESLRLDERLVPALTLYAKIAMTRNRFDAAQDSLRRALAVDPDSASARFLLGLSFYLTNDLPHALSEFEKARQSNPKDARAALYLGLTNESLGRTSAALTMYEESVRLGPTSDAYLTGFRLLRVLGRLDDCRRWIERSLVLDPTSRDAHFEFARFLLQVGDLARAAQEAEHALALPGGETTDAQIHYLLIRAYRESDPARSARHAEAFKASEANRAGVPPPNPPGGRN